MLVQYLLDMGSLGGDGIESFRRVIAIDQSIALVPTYRFNSTRPEHYRFYGFLSLPVSSGYSANRR